MAKKPPDPYSYGDFADWKEPKLRVWKAILCGAMVAPTKKSKTVVKPRWFMFRRTFHYSKCLRCLRLKHAHIIHFFSPTWKVVYDLMWTLERHRFMNYAIGFGWLHHTFLQGGFLLVIQKLKPLWHIYIYISAYITINPFLKLVSFNVTHQSPTLFTALRWADACCGKASPVVSASKMATGMRWLWGVVTGGICVFSMVETGRNRTISRQGKAGKAQIHKAWVIYGNYILKCYPSNIPMN